MHKTRNQRRKADLFNPFQHKTRRFFAKDDAGEGGGGGGAPDPKIAADKAAADAKQAADKAAADAAAAKAAADKATADQKAALDKAAKDAQDAADAAKKAADAAKATAEKLTVAQQAEADRKAAEKKAADEADPEDGAEVTLKQKNLRDIKDKAAAKALKDKAKELGFESVEAMEAAAKKLNESQTDSRLTEILANQKRLEAELHQSKLSGRVREAALRAGFADASYAEFLANQQVGGKAPAEALAFDFDGYFKNLKGTHAHLFTAIDVPANTGANAGSAPKPPAANEAVGKAAKETVKSVHDMTPEQFEAEKRRRFGVYAEG